MTPSFRVARKLPCKATTSTVIIDRIHVGHVMQVEDHRQRLVRLKVSARGASGPVPWTRVQIPTRYPFAWNPPGCIPWIACLWCGFDKLAFDPPRRGGLQRMTLVRGFDLRMTAYYRPCSPQVPCQLTAGSVRSEKADRLRRNSRELRHDWGHPRLQGATARSEGSVACLSPGRTVVA